MQFTASFEGKYAPIVFNKDIYIGTVALNKQAMKSCMAGLFNRPFVDSLERMNENPPLNPAMMAGSEASLTQIITASQNQVS